MARTVARKRVSPEVHRGTKPTKAERHDVEAALAIVRRIPALDMFASDYSFQSRTGSVQAERDTLKRLHDSVNHTICQHMPELQVPRPLACVDWSVGIATPYSNLLSCKEFCHACVGEALLTLEAVLDPQRRVEARRTAFASKLLAARVIDHAKRRTDRRRAQELTWSTSRYTGEGFKAVLAGPRGPVDITKLSDAERTILLDLFKHHPNPRLSSELADAIDRAPGGIGQTMSNLKSLELVRPVGRRKGYLLTERGLVGVSRLPRRYLSAISKR
jgi:hypothetical protein